MKNQDKARQLVEREIYCCVSSLMGGIAQIAHEVNYKMFSSAFDTDPDALMDLFQRPDYIEVYEHWVVSSWLKSKLEAKGEVVGEFAGLDIWGRCCTGQAICMDSVIQEIANEVYS